MDELSAVRQCYADLIRTTAKIDSDELMRAFATVPRERFLRPGPWRIVSPPAGYRTTESADARHIYANVPVALDPSRNLNNGQPGFLAVLIDALEVHRGEHVVHLGCGSGYYSAILGEMVGPSGHVTALEVDAGLAKWAKDNLADTKHVEVRHVDGSLESLGHLDAILVNAGATHPLPVWLDSLRPGARLVLPLTVAPGDDPPIGMGVLPAAIGTGLVLKVRRSEDGYSAAFVYRAQIFHCVGARSDAGNARLRAALNSGGAESVRSLRRDHHEKTDACWLHGADFCLSASPPSTIDAEASPD